MFQESQIDAVTEQVVFLQRFLNDLVEEKERKELLIDCNKKCKELEMGYNEVFNLHEQQAMFHPEEVKKSFGETLALKKKHDIVHHFLASVLN